MTTVYEHIIMTKKRSNSKKWELAQREYDETLHLLDETPKQKMVVYAWENADSIEQVKEINNAVTLLIVMSPLGHSPSLRRLDTRKILEDAATAHTCSVTGARVVVANCY